MADAHSPQQQALTHACASPCLRVASGGVAGLGKTTLAHVVARHCGYRPLEINASDDRTAATLVGRIHDAVQMQAIIGAARPNCVIIDEIDGATGALCRRPVPTYWRLRMACTSHSSSMACVIHTFSSDHEQQGLRALTCAPVGWCT